MLVVWWRGSAGGVGRGSAGVGRGIVLVWGEG